MNAPRRSVPPHAPHAAPFLSAPWPERLGRWTRAWELPGFEQSVRIDLSRRMRVTLGRCAVERREIRLAAFLLDGPEALLEEVLCHELAHAAVGERHGYRCAPHGPEWRALMTAAGFRPRARLPAEEFERVLPMQRTRRVVWEHHCPRCGLTRNAGRPVYQWRCRHCWERGFDGVLGVRKLGVEDAAK